MDVDTEGFWYPQVDKEVCINCGLCEKVCPQLHVDELKSNKLDTPVCYGAIHKNIETRFKSTSGGLFSALAEEMYKRGGYVGGAIYGENWKVQHFISNNPEDLERLRQSKYSQSDTEGFYKEVKTLLLRGERVLVCGTPCQMAGLRTYLGNKEYDRLIIVDFICKSITSPKFYSLVLDYWERKAKSKLVGFKFKDKELGWRNLVKRYDFKNGKTSYCRASDKDVYSTAYHGNIVSRPSCYNCKFKGFPRMADITVADFWGCERYAKYKGIDDNAGTSAVIINTQKGVDYFETIKPSIRCVPADIKEMIPGNPALTQAQHLPTANRQDFFKDLGEMPIEEVIPKYMPWFGEKKRKNLFKIKTIAKSLIKGLKYSQYHPITIIKFLYYNTLCKEVNAKWSKGAVLYPTPSATIELQKGAKLNLDGPIIVGTKKLKHTKAEARFLVESNGTLNVKTSFRIFCGSDVEVFKGATMNVDDVGMNYGCTIICGQRIDFEGYVALGREVSIRDTNAHIVAMDGYKVTRPVKIEPHVWLCSGCTINPGVKIHTGAIVSAGSFVASNIPAHCLVSGNPAKIVARDIAWKI